MSFIIWTLVINHNYQKKYCWFQCVGHPRCMSTPCFLAGAVLVNSSSFLWDGSRLLPSLQTWSLQWLPWPNCSWDGLLRDTVVNAFSLSLSKSLLISYEHPACHKAMTRYISQSLIYILPFPASLTSSYPPASLDHPPSIGLAYMLWGKVLFFKELRLRHHFTGLLWQLNGKCSKSTRVGNKC